MSSWHSKIKWRAQLNSKTPFSPRRALWEGGFLVTQWFGLYTWCDMTTMMCNESEFSRSLQPSSSRRHRVRRLSRLRKMRDVAHAIDMPGEGLSPETDFNQSPKQSSSLSYLIIRGKAKQMRFLSSYPKEGVCLPRKICERFFHFHSEAKSPLYPRIFQIRGRTVTDTKSTDVSFRTHAVYM